jgi:hypothetical protein
MAQIEYEFEELPLVVDADLAGMLIDGVATIEYDRNCQWSVLEITVDGYSKGPARPIKIDSQLNGLLFGTIANRLEENPFADSVHDAIERDMDDRRADANEYRYEQMRDRRMEEAS